MEDAYVKLIAMVLLCGFGFAAQAAGFGDLVDQAKGMTGDSAIEALGQQFGLEDTQVESGIGSILPMAQTRLKSGEFDQLIGAIPGGPGYMETAKSLGLLDLPLENIDGVVKALSGAGWSPDVAADFVPGAIKALGNLGGSDVQQMLASLL